MSLRSFVQRPLQVAAKLNQGAAGGSYVEAAILVSGVISSIAATIWPGNRIDRKRFVEAWVRLSPADANAVRVSLPLLRHELLRQGRRADAAAVERLRPQFFRPGQDCLVLTGRDVDVEEGDLVTACRALDTGLCRQFSYPALFYSEVRSSLVHEYLIGNVADTFPMTEQDASVSYTNNLVKYEETDECIERVVKKRVHFHLPWLVGLADGLAQKADDLLARRPVEVPARWWCDGG